jgi:hypothetical protein
MKALSKAVSMNFISFCPLRRPSQRELVLRASHRGGMLAGPLDYFSKSFSSASIAVCTFCRPSAALSLLPV